MKSLHVLYEPQVIGRRVAALGKRISRDFRGQTLDVVAVLDNAFVFAADLVRAVKVPVRTHFIHAEMQDIVDPNNGRERKEVFFTPPVEANGRNILVVEGVVRSGITTDFLLCRIGLRQPRVVKTAVCVDRPSERKVALESDYAAFQLASNSIVVGYGLTWEGKHGQLPYLGSLGRVKRERGERRGAAEKGAGKVSKKARRGRKRE